MRINNNLAAMNALLQLGKNSSKKTKSTEKLSSGFRINRAADDAAGLAISEKMRAQIRGLNQASRNIGDGISLVQTADGGMQEIQNIMQRGRELVVQALNDSNDRDIDKPAIQAELDQLSAEIEDMAHKIEFNGIKLLSRGGTNASTTAAKFAAQFNAEAAQVLGGAATFKAAAAPEEMAAEPIQKVDFAPMAQLMPPTGAAAWSVTGSNEITIIGSGVLDLSSAALGDISGYTIQVNAASVQLNQTGGQLKNVTINCATDTNLFVNGLDILQTEDKSAIKFTSGDNTLNLMGTNTFVQNGSNVAFDAGGVWRAIESSLIQIDSPAALEINNASGHSGTLDAVINGDAASNIRVHSAIIGGSVNKSGGDLKISGGEILASFNGCDVMYASVIGSGSGGDFGDITITGGTVKALLNEAETHRWPTIAAIGGVVGDITISGGVVYAKNSAGSGGGPAIGGIRYGSITISGGSVTAEMAAGDGSAIGGKSRYEAGGAITLSGGQIWATTTGTNITGAAIGGCGAGGGAAYQMGADLTISGGILHISGSHIGAGKRYDGQIAFSVDPGTVTFTSKDDINALFDYIQPPIYNNQSVILDAGGTPLYRTRIDGVSFVPNSSVSYKIDGVNYSAQVHSNGTLYLYQPLSDNGKKVEFNSGGYTLTGMIDSTVSHDNVIALSEPPDPPVDPPPVDPPPPDPPPNPPVNPVDPVDPTAPTSRTGDIWIQSGANQNEGVWLSTYDCRAKTLGVDKLHTDPRDMAEKSLSDLSKAINTVSMYRADAGAKQNRLEHSLRNVENTAENLSAAESRIRDVDMAKEMSEYVKSDIISQAATAMLAQANSQPNSVLQLLQG